MWASVQALWQRWVAPPVQIDAAQWQQTLQGMAFLQALNHAEQARLRQLCEAFLARKEFHGLLDLRISDEMALAIAAQACLPLLHLAPPDKPAQALVWYDSFVSVIVSPREVPVQRMWQDEAGVVHSGVETVSGEVSEDGPVLLSWPDVLAGMGQPTAQWLAQRAAEHNEARAQGHLPMRADTPYNVVIHEFCHKLDMRSGEADGCPPLPAGCLGHAKPAQARREWLARLGEAFDTHVEQLEAADRFGQPMPWLDAYGASELVEFFPVACEAYFTQRERFAQEWPDLLALFDAFFRPRAALA